MGNVRTLIIGGSLILLVALVFLLNGTKATPHEVGDKGSKHEIVAYCAVGIRAPIEALAKDFEQETGVHVSLDYDNSGGLLGKLKLERATPHCDIFIPAESSYLKQAQEADLVRETFPLAKFHLVLAVKPGNPKKIEKLGDLERQGVLFELCNPEAAAGKITEKALSPSGAYAKLKPLAKAMKPTVTEAAMDVKLAQDIDAAIVWDATARQFDLEMVELPALTATESVISGAVIASCQQPTDALAFLRFVTASDRGAKVFTANHYIAMPGDPWTIRPILRIFAGGSTRMAVEKTLADFEAREGCELEVQYGGCGTLNAAIKAAKGNIDVYLTCDGSFLEKVKEYFEPSNDVSETRLVLAVRKEKAAEIRTLKDLAKPGVHIGLGEEETGALGALSARILREAGLYDAVQKNKPSAFPTAHELVLAMGANDSLDAAIVYEANVQRVDPQKIVICQIDLPSAVARQNIGVSRASTNKQLAMRFAQNVLSSVSRARFESEGYKWATPPPIPQRAP